MIGALACATSLRSVAFVCRLAWFNFLIILLNHFLWKVAGPPVVPAWSIPKTNSASNICSVTALLSRVGVKDLMPIVPFMASWSSLAMLGSCRYVESVVSRKGSRLIEPFRLGAAQTSAHATTFVGVPWTIALRLGVAVVVRSRRSAVKLSWRRTVSKGLLNPSEFL